MAEGATGARGRRRRLCVDASLFALPTEVGGGSPRSPAPALPARGWLRLSALGPTPVPLTIRRVWTLSPSYARSGPTPSGARSGGVSGRGKPRGPRRVSSLLCLLGDEVRSRGDPDPPRSRRLARFGS